MQTIIRCEKCGKLTTDIGVITPRCCDYCGEAFGLRGHIGETWYDQVYVERIDCNVEGYVRIFMIPYDSMQCIGKIIWDTHVNRKNCPCVGDMFNAEMRVKDHAYRRTYITHLKIDKENPAILKYSPDLPCHNMWSP